VLQRIKDLITSSTFGPIFSVLVVLRIEAAVGFSATKWTAQLGGQGMRNDETKAKNATRPLLEAQLRGNVA